MKIIQTLHKINDLAPDLRGVFTIADLRNLLGTKHPRTSYQQVKRLEEEGVFFFDCNDPDTPSWTMGFTGVVQ